MLVTVKSLRRPSLLVFAAILALLIIGRVLMPNWLLHQVNGRLGNLETYRGHVQEIDLMLSTGTYVMKGVTFEKHDGEVRVPLLSVESIRLSLRWDALLAGRLEGEAHIHRPVLNLVDGPDADRDQFGTEQDWRKTVREAYPLDINHVSIAHGEAYFRNFHSTPKINVAVRQIHARAANLRNRAVSDSERQAEIHVDALGPQQTPVTLSGTYEWLQRLPEFSFDFKMQDLPVQALNELARVYASLDPAAGTLTLTAEIEARQGELSGYVKPLLRNLEILSWEQDVKKAGKNPFQLAWEGVTEFISELLENEDTDTIGSRVPISGEIGQAGPEVFPAVLSTLRNAFVEALSSDFEQAVSLPRLEEESENE